MPPKTLPFKNLNADAWRNLALAAVALLYVANFIALIIKVGIMNGIGGDFLVYWSAGKIARTFGFSQIYSLDILGQVQYLAIGKTNLQTMGAPSVLLPFLYLSFYLIPFYFFSFLSLSASYWLWTFVNFTVLIFYLLFLMRNYSKGKSSPTHQKIILLSLLLSYPVHATIIYGQIELINVICCGEFLRNAVNKKPVISGLWLGGLLLKPQLLILVVLALVLMKNWKIIYGFMISAVGIFAISASLSGIKGSMDLIKLWMDTGQTTGSFTPEVMANWRMIGVNLNNWTSTSFGWILTIIGMLATIALWVILVKKNPVMGSYYWVATLMAVFAASCLVAWHSYIHSAMLLLPFLLIAQFSRLPDNPHRLLDLFVFSFPITLISGSVVTIILMVLHLPPIDHLLDFSLGFAGVIVYLTFLITGIKMQPRETSLQIPLQESTPTIY